MKKLIFTSSFILLGSFTFSSNAAITKLQQVDCYEEAFDYMESAEALGFDEESIKLAGEYYYCQCAENCSWG